MWEPRRALNRMRAVRNAREVERVRRRRDSRRLISPAPGSGLYLVDIPWILALGILFVIMVGMAFLGLAGLIYLIFLLVRYLFDVKLVGAVALLSCASCW